MNTEISLKIAECVSFMIDNNLTSHIWRGMLSDGEWKILISAQDTYENIDIKLKKRSNLTVDGE